MIERDTLAAEHSLRLLEGEALMEARRLAATDPAFAGEVERWDERFAPWFDEIAEEAPSERVWQQILRRLDEHGGTTVVGLKRKLAVWRTAAAAAAVAAGVLLTLQLAPTDRAPPPAVPTETARPAPLLIASLAAETSGEALTITVISDSRELVVSPTRLEPGANRTRELWVIPEGGNPVSLGVVGTDAVQRRTLPADLARRLAANATLAVSDEPTGGSPTGQPTGAVLATGTLVAV